MIWGLVAACALASIPVGLRWLRVAQREHYLPLSVIRFAGRWWKDGPVNSALLLVAVSATVASLALPLLAFLVPITQVVGPVGLSIKGTSSPLAWTGRLKRVGAVAGVATAALYVLGGVLGLAVVPTAVLLALPLLVDLSLAVMRPIERRLGRGWVDKAEAKLRAIAPDVVAITGSYGKTTTKNYVAHLLAGSRRTLASPASFNNRMGLARAVNENLTPGTEVFVAEMGTYGPGEIAELCHWIPPKVAALVAIGPVHLERFRTEERIVTAKAEILELAEVGVINVDHPLLARLADERASEMRIVRVSAAGGVISVDDVAVAHVPDGAFPANAAVALGISLVLGVPGTDLIARLGDLPSAEHRQSVSLATAGFTIIDDTFNSNPAGARRALEVLEQYGRDGRKVVVTPGMVELGPKQQEENAEFAALAAKTADQVIVVGRTNRGALLRGSARGTASVTVVSSREDAVAWVREHLGPGDAVLYENDLPDHYP